METNCSPYAFGFELSHMTFEYSRLKVARSAPSEESIWWAGSVSKKKTGALRLGE
jgi:hypothetical protein